MRYTPFLDEIGVTLKPEVPDHAAAIIDHCLAILDRQIDWGSYEGKKRKRCLEQPLLLTGMPIGQYHCPQCLMMLMAGAPHFSPEAVEQHCTCETQDDDAKEHTTACALMYPLGHYEDEYGRPWPPGYEEPE